MKAIESYWKDTVAVFLKVSGEVISCNSFSDFPSTNYAKYYSTKRKSVKIASDSASLQLISYSPIFASNFQICCYCHDTIMVLSTHTFVRAVSFDDE